jgi:hypothetical protein
MMMWRFVGYPSPLRQQLAPYKANNKIDRQTVNMHMCTFLSGFGSTFSTCGTPVDSLVSSVSDVSSTWYIEFAKNGSFAEKHVSHVHEIEEIARTRN